MIQIPVAILHENLNPKHKVISLITPQVAIQLIPYPIISKNIKSIAFKPLKTILFFFANFLIIFLLMNLYSSI